MDEQSVEYYPVIKRNEVLIYTTTWLNLENFMLNEVGQIQKDKYSIIPFTYGI